MHFRGLCHGRVSGMDAGTGTVVGEKVRRGMLVLVASGLSGLEGDLQNLILFQGLGDLDFFSIGDTSGIWQAAHQALNLEIST